MVLSSGLSLHHSILGFSTFNFVITWEFKMDLAAHKRLLYMHSNTGYNKGQKGNFKNIR